jgi:hypothetical protein
MNRKNTPIKKKKADESKKLEKKPQPPARTLVTRF